MGKKKKGKIFVGLDGIDVNIKTEKVLQENYYCKKNTKDEEIWHLKACKGGYLLHLCLPKTIRETNEIPFTTTDFEKLNEILEDIKYQIQQLFGNEMPKMIVRNCEVNSTAELSDKTKTAPMLSLLSTMLLTRGEKIFVCYVGEKTGKRYEAVKNLCNSKRIESIRTSRLSNGRVSFKIYDKAKQQGRTDKGLLRTEFIYSRRGLDIAKTGQTLEEFLTIPSISSLLKCYRADYKTMFIDTYWNHSDSYNLNDDYNVPIHEEMVRIIYNDLVRSNGKPRQCALINKELIEIDFHLFEKACDRFYGNKESSRKACYRIRKSGEFVINTNIIDEFVNISKQIIYS